MATSTGAVIVLTILALRAVHSQDDPSQLRPAHVAPLPPMEPRAEELPDPNQDPTQALIRAGVLPPASSREAMPVVPVIPFHAYDALSVGAFDAVGSMDDPQVIEPRSRPMYPYGHEEYWYGHDANVEEWGDLLELPYVRLGWFAIAEASIFQPHVNGHISSGTFLEGTFPGNPVALGPGGLNWSVAPKLEVGYRYEHGLGEIRAAYQHFSASGQDPLPAFDTAGLGIHSTTVRLDIADLDLWSNFEFNPEGMPLIMPLFLDPGRLGLGTRKNPGWLVPPLEMRWFFGARFADFFYETVGRGDLRRERIVNSFIGGGVHFGIDLNQRLPSAAPLYLHARAEGSGVFGFLNQQFSRSVAGGPSASGGFKNDGIGVPSVNLELGLAWAPHWPSRDVRVTFAYQYGEWFSWASTDINNADLIMNGILLRAEGRF